MLFVGYDFWSLITSFQLGTIHEKHIPFFINYDVNHWSHFNNAAWNFLLFLIKAIKKCVLSVTDRQYDMIIKANFNYHIWVTERICFNDSTSNLVNQRIKLSLFYQENSFWTRLASNKRKANEVNVWYRDVWSLKCASHS